MVRSISRCMCGHHFSLCIGITFFGKFDGHLLLLCGLFRSQRRGSGFGEIEGASE